MICVYYRSLQPWFWGLVWGLLLVGIGQPLVAQSSPMPTVKPSDPQPSPNTSPIYLTPAQASSELVQRLEERKRQIESLQAELAEARKLPPTLQTELTAISNSQSESATAIQQAQTSAQAVASVTDSQIASLQTERDQAKNQVGLWQGLTVVGVVWAVVATIFAVIGGIT